MTRASRVSMRRKSRLQRAVRQLGDLPGHLDAGRAGADDDEGHQPLDLGRVVGHARRARSEPKMRPRSSSASSILFMPGANSANWSLPK